MPELQTTDIEGVYVLPLSAHPDSRGSFTEVYRRDGCPGPEMPQANLSLSKANVLRGLHFHREQADYWCIFTGRAFVGLYDLRVGSPTEGRRRSSGWTPRRNAAACTSRRAWLTASTRRPTCQLPVPGGQYYTGADEFGVAWDDPGARPRLAGHDPDPLGPGSVEPASGGGAARTRPRCRDAFRPGLAGVSTGRSRHRQ